MARARSELRRRNLPAEPPPLSRARSPDCSTDGSWLPNKGKVGFGIDFAVRLRPPADANENPGEVGEFFWDGRDSTLFWVDPANDLSAVLMVQLIPFDRIGLHRSCRRPVYDGIAPAK